MVNAQYLPLDTEEVIRGEIIFATEEWTHLMIEGTDTIAVVPTQDTYPA